MSKVAVVFWSSSGNTETMAEAVLEGAKGAGAEAEMINCADFNADMVDQYDGIALGWAMKFWKRMNFSRYMMHARENWQVRK